MNQDWKPVAGALLGSWPSQVSSWGREALAAFFAELEARGVSPDRALVAIRSHDGAFPPSAGELAALARCDPSQPTFVECYALIYGRGGILRARPAESTFADEGERGRAYRAAQRARAATMHPLVGSFVDRYGLDRLELLPLNDPEWGDAKRRDLEAAWDAHVEANEGRLVRAIAERRGDGLARLDPLSSLPGAERFPLRQIGDGR